MPWSDYLDSYDLEYLAQHDPEAYARLMGCNPDAPQAVPPVPEGPGPFGMSWNDWIELGLAAAAFALTRGSVRAVPRAFGANPPSVLIQP